MRRVIVIAAAGVSLAGCSSFSWDAFKSTPPTVQIQLESTPPGADARTSLGPGCKTPCSVTSRARGSDFTVTYTLNKFQPVTVPVQVIRLRRWIGQDRSQSGRRRTSALGPPPKPARKKMPAETEAAKGGRGPAPPRNRRSPTRRQRRTGSGGRTAPPPPAR